MRKKQFALACLVALAMIAGFAARSHVSPRIGSFSSSSNQSLSRPLSASAPSSASSDVGIRSDVDLRPLEIFYSVLDRVRNEFVEPIKQSQEHDLTYGALRAMLDSLRDPLTRFYDPQQAKIVEAARLGKFYGPGVLVTVKQAKQGDITEEQLVVLSALPGSPAEKADVRTGDVITEIDGKAILPYDPFQRIDKLIKDARNGAINDEKLRKLVTVETDKIKDGIMFQKAMDTLSSKATKDVTLTLARQGSDKPLKVKLSSDETTVEPISVSTIKPTVGCIHVNLLVSSAENKFADALADLRKKGVTSLILDLRNSPGGDISSAEAIAGDLIPKKTLALLEIPQGKKETLLAGDARGEAWSGDIIVLVNGGTSGASEVLAAAIRDSAGAQLVGDKTSGTAFQQTFIQLRDGSAFSMTTGKYLTSKGADYHNKGLVPDIAIGNGSGSGDDAQLSKAVELITSGKAKG